MDQYSPYLMWIDEQQEAMVSLLINWANIHSGSDNLEGLQEMSAALQQAFSELGGTVDHITLPTRKTLTLNGKIKESPLGEALSITKNPQAPIQILLCGHMDIALLAKLPLKKCDKPRPKGRGVSWKELRTPPNSSELNNPSLKEGVFSNFDKTLCGQGTCDMKGGLLVMLMALKAFEKSPFAGKLGWRVLITPDEEVGSPGSCEILTQAAKNYNLGLVFEPSLPDGSLVSARKGSANFSVAIRGKAAHAGREFHEGYNAITSAARFALAAESLTDLKEETTINIGYLEGGGSVNTVPEKAYCRFNVRGKKVQQLQLIQEKLKKIADIENNRKGISVTLHKDTERPPKKFDKKTKALFESLKLSATHLGFDLDWKSTGGVCDGNTLASAGLTTIDTLGVVGGNTHTPEEYVVLDSLVERSKLTARFLMQIATGEINI